MTQPETYKRIAAQLDAADYILIGAGAGLSAAAGLDYTDSELFAKLFPGLYKQGFRRFYDLFGYTDWSEAQKWGYLANQVHYVRFRPNPHPVYTRLFELVKEKDYFVMTSNVDAMFPRNGFDAMKLYTPQGAYDQMQCLTPCWRETWPTKPIIDRILPTVDPITHTVKDPDVIPTCPNCGGPVFLNVRGGAWFIEEPYVVGYERLTKWIRATIGKSLLILEIGAGFNTPSVIRWPMEQITKHHDHAQFVRINMHHSDVPQEISEKSISISGDAFEAINGIWQAVKSHNS